MNTPHTPKTQTLSAQDPARRDFLLREFSEDAYPLAAEPKELHIVPGAGHVDLYDRVDLIPFDKLAGFFSQHLSKDGAA